jgi:hypothetical protein
MVKKISYAIIAVAILITGYIGFNKLNYWERSFWIFNSSGTNQRFEGRMGRGRVGFEGRGELRGREGFARPQMREIPDSVRARFEEGRRGQGMRNRNMPDSLRQQFPQNDINRSGRIPAEGAFRNGEGRGRGEFQGGKKIRLTNVWWFLAVFAAFTLIVIYIDKAYSLIRKRRQISP